MSRIAQCFKGLQAQGHKALIPFVTAGDPEPSITVPLMHALVDAGANIMELGIPFSDPMADGPVIQRAAERALARRVSLHDVFSLVRAFRAKDTHTPVVLMGYLNPLEAMGYDRFADEAADAGVDGILTVDLPPEEADALVQAVGGQEIDPIFLLAPTSDDGRIASVCARASGFVYYVSLKGVTGAAHLDIASVAEKIARIRTFTDLPVGVGFGIRDAASAARVATIADAVVVGSALVAEIESLLDQRDQIVERVSALVGEMRKAMDETRVVV
jgi:tryptophan synthase alpha chain